MVMKATEIIAAVWNRAGKRERFADPEASTVTTDGGGRLTVTLRASDGSVLETISAQSYYGAYGFTVSSDFELAITIDGWINLDDRDLAIVTFPHEDALRTLFLPMEELDHRAWKELCPGLSHDEIAAITHRVRDFADASRRQRNPGT